MILQVKTVLSGLWDPFRAPVRASIIVNPRKLEHELRMIRAGIPYTLL